MTSTNHSTNDYEPRTTEAMLDEILHDDGEPFTDKMQGLGVELRHQQSEAARLDAAIAANLNSLGFDHNLK